MDSIQKTIVNDLAVNLTSEIDKITKSVLIEFCRDHELDYNKAEKGELRDVFLSNTNAHKIITLSARTEKGIINLVSFYPPEIDDLKSEPYKIHGEFKYNIHYQGKTHD